jgi:hypothetical protein
MRRGGRVTLARPGLRLGKPYDWPGRKFGEVGTCPINPFRTPLSAFRVLGLPFPVAPVSPEFACELTRFLRENLFA